MVKQIKSIKKIISSGAGKIEKNFNKLRIKVDGKALNEYRTNMENKNILRHYKTKKNSKPSNGIVKGSRLLLKTRTGILKVRARDWGKENRRCQIYGDAIERVENLLLEYKEYEWLREELAFGIKDILDQGEYQ